RRRPPLGEGREFSRKGRTSLRNCALCCGADSLFPHFLTFPAVMTRFSPSCAHFGAAVAVLGLAALTPAFGAGFLVREDSAEAVATSYAGNGSRATGPDTVFSNPAGMTRL